MVETTLVVLSNCLQTHIFWNFDYISRIYNKINYRNIWFPKMIIIFLSWWHKCFFLIFFPKKTRTLMPLSKTMKLLGSTDKRITKQKNIENFVQLEITDTVLVYCNLANNTYQHGSRFVYVLIRNKLYGYLIHILFWSSKKS